jgi:MoaA/NifB/PqqE/SkfB family radical SAM enzyme
MISVLITSKCNYKCDHCLFNCTAKGEHITQETLNSLPKIFEHSDSVNIIGGEPTINPDFKNIMIDLSNKTPYGHYRIVSNGSFVYSNKKREKMLEVVSYALNNNKHDGVSLTISNDDYHIPFWKEYKHLDLIKWMFEDLGYNKDNGFYLDLSKRESQAVMSKGRAVKNQLFCDMDNKTANCADLVSDKDENGKVDLYRIWEDLTIFPNGDYYPCCNADVKLGNINKESIDLIENKLLAFYNHLNPDLKYGDCKNCKTINKTSMQEVNKLNFA